VTVLNLYFVRVTAKMTRKFAHFYRCDLVS